MIQELIQEERMTSLQIAEVVGKTHAHVMRDIRNMEEAWAKVNQSKFGLVEYTDAKGEKRPCYSLTKIECLYVATKYNDEARAKLVLRWEKLEKEHQAKIQKALPKSYPEALRMLADETEKNERLALENKEKQKVIEEQQPKVLFADSMQASEKSCYIKELADVLAQNGIKIGRNRLFDWLRDNGYLCTSGAFKNQPKQKYIEMGLFQVSRKPFLKNGVTIISTTTMITQKGQMYFINKFLNKGMRTLNDMLILRGEELIK